MRYLPDDHLHQKPDRKRSEETVMICENCGLDDTDAEGIAFRKFFKAALCDCCYAEWRRDHSQFGVGA